MKRTQWIEIGRATSNGITRVVDVLPGCGGFLVSIFECTEDYGISLDIKPRTIQPLTSSSTIVFLPADSINDITTMFFKADDS